MISKAANRNLLAWLAEAPLVDRTLWAESIEHRRDLPNALKSMLRESVTSDVFPELAEILTDYFRERHEESRRHLVSIAYYLMISALAWIGIAVSFGPMVEHLKEAFQFAKVDSTWWLHSLEKLKEALPVWVIGIPFGISFCLIARRWIAGHRGHLSGFDISRLSLELADRLSQRMDMTAALPLAHRIVGGKLHAEIRYAIESMPTEMGSERIRHSQWIGAIHWYRKMQAIERRWWMERFPRILGTLSALLILGVYLLIGVLPWLWLVSKMLNSLASGTPG